MVFHNNICYLLQKAAAAFLKGTDPDPAISTISFLDQAHLFQGLSASNVSNPRVVCQALKATADTQFEGNWLVNLRIYLYDNADDMAAGAEDSFHEHAGEVFSKFMTDTIAADLSAALTDFTAQFVLPTEQGWGVHERTWFAYLDLSINCAGSDIDMS
jgi:hypothetical protein